MGTGTGRARMTGFQQTDKLPKKVKFGLIPQAASKIPEADKCSQTKSCQLADNQNLEGLLKKTKPR